MVYGSETSYSSSSCRDIDPVEDTESLGSTITIRHPRLRCRDIDPVEDTESSIASSMVSPSTCCRDIDPVEDTESS